MSKPPKSPKPRPSIAQRLWNNMVKHPWATILFTIIFTSISTKVADRIFEKRDSIVAEYAILAQGKQEPQVSVGQLSLSFATDNFPADNLQVLVKNKGDNAAEALQLSVHPIGGLKIQSWEIEQDPYALQRNTSNGANPGTKPLAIMWPSFPTNTKATVSVILSTNPVPQTNVMISVFDKKNNWPVTKASIALRTRLSNSMLSIFKGFHIAGVREANAATVNASSSTVRRSGMYIGGYDPVAISENTFHLFQTKGIVTPAEAELVVNEIRKPAAGVSVGGVNILKTDEILMNVLIQKKQISFDDAQTMLDRSKGAGGFQINGINVIRLKAEILNALVQRKIITLKEAQLALDSAKGTK